MKRAPSNTFFKNGFREAYEMLTLEQRYILKRKIEDRIGWSSATFYMRKNGVIPVRKIEMNIVDQCFKEFDIDIWAVTKN